MSLCTIRNLIRGLFLDSKDEWLARKPDKKLGINTIEFEWGLYAN